MTGGSAAGTTSYNYNALNQLTSYSSAGRSVALTYDTVGNRTRRVVSGTAASDAGTDSYSYDYRTRRVVRDETNAGGVLTSVVFSGGVSVQEYAAGSTYTAVEYIRGSDYGGGVGGILYTLRGSDPSFTHENRRGDVIAKTNASGALTYQASYEAYGTRTQENGSTADRQKANTKDEDPTGLLNEGFRYRDLETGVFITADPAGFVDGPNLYTYVKQNPWTSFDPEGLETKSDYEKDKEAAAAEREKSLNELKQKYAAGTKEYDKESKKIYDSYWKRVDRDDARISSIEETAKLSCSKAARLFAGISKEIDANTVDDTSNDFIAMDSARNAIELLKIAGVPGEGKIAEGASILKNRIAFEAYKDFLRSQMGKPAAANPELKAIFGRTL